MYKTKIINAIKGVFSTLGAKTSDSNYAVALLDKTSAEPKGMMDFANLASVLGGAQTTLTSGNCNNITAPGVYDLKREVLNQPFLYTTVVVYKRGNTIHQVGYDADNCQSAYRLFDGTTWKSWARTDNFGCNTPADLASLLGGIKGYAQPGIGGTTTISLGNARTIVMLAWVNSGLTQAPAILMAGRNGAITMVSGGGDGNLNVADVPDSFCVFKAANDSNAITVKNNTSYNLSLFYYLIYIE